METKYALEGLELEVLAIQAYICYCKAMNYKDENDLALPVWHDLSDKVKAAWRASAISVARTVQDFK